ncbi:MAG: paraquat-inducible protein A [Saprospiraceae bacterium]|nr:paraquat-inducible protein A [Saprospiraceae bacterium]
MSYQQIKILPILLSIMFLVLGIYLNQQLIDNSIQLKEEKNTYTQKLNYKKRFLDKNEWIKGSKGSIVVNTTHLQLEQRIKDKKEAIYTSTQLILLSCILYGLLMLLFQYIQKQENHFALGIISLSLVCLHAGLFCPMLEIAAFEQDLDLGKMPISTTVLGVDISIKFEKVFEGRMYFFYQSKSVKELIGVLFSQGNYVVGISILSFSVLFPLIKTLITLWACLQSSISQRKWFKLFIANLGKWSMADVFVVATFLAFLAFDNMQVGVGTESNTLLGLYFFIAYCFLSILSSSILKKQHKHQA